MRTTDGAEDTLGSIEGDWDGLSDGIPEVNLDGTSDAVTVGLMDGCDVILNEFNSVINDNCNVFRPINHSIHGGIASIVQRDVPYFRYGLLIMI